MWQQEEEVTLLCPTFAIRYQKHVHTYRILPDGEDFLAVQVGPWTSDPCLTLIQARVWDPTG